MRLSRPCYDKYHRCPGWAGGGNHFPKTDKHKCDGYVNWSWVPDDSEDGGHRPKLFKWRFNKCNKCDVIVLPYMIRKVDPTNWASVARMFIDRARHADLLWALQYTRLGGKIQMWYWHRQAIRNEKYNNDHA